MALSAVREFLSFTLCMSQGRFHVGSLCISLLSTSLVKTGACRCSVPKSSVNTGAYSAVDV